MTETVDPIYYPDKAIQSVTSDRFNFNPTAEVLAKNISRLSVDDSYTIAVNGEWGSGKSSFLNLVRQHLETSDEDENKNIVLDFDPWMFSGREDVVMQLFLHIRAELQNLNNERKGYLNPNIFSTLDSVLGCLQSISSLSGIPGIHGIIGGIKFGNQILADKNQDKIDEINNINAQRKQLCNKLKNLSAKLVIIIDNIDRLTGTEIRQIFQAIKAVSDFPNIVYILAYDQRIVEDALEFEFHQHYSTTPESGREYLKKIVQFSLPVPDTTPYLKGYAEELLLSLNEVTHPHNWSRYPGVVDRWNALYQYGLSPILKTPRDIIRLYNILALVSASYNPELDFLDLLCIQVIREYEPELYETIRQNPKYFTGKAYNFSDYDYLLHGMKLEDIEYPDDTECELYFSHIFQKYSSKWNILYLVVLLFPSIQYLNSYNSGLYTLMSKIPILNNPSTLLVESKSLTGIRIHTHQKSFMECFGCHMSILDGEEHWEDIIFNFWTPSEFHVKLKEYENKRPSQGLVFLSEILMAVHRYGQSMSEDIAQDILHALLSVDISLYRSESHNNSYKNNLWDISKNILISLFKCQTPDEAISSFSKSIPYSTNIILVSFILEIMWKFQHARMSCLPSDTFGKMYSYDTIKLALPKFKRPWEETFSRLIGDDPFNLLLPKFESFYYASQISEITKKQLDDLITKIWSDDFLLVSFIHKAITERYLTRDNLALLLIYNTISANSTIDRASEKIESIIQTEVHSGDVVASLREYKRLLYERTTNFKGNRLANGGNFV